MHSRKNNPPILNHTSTKATQFSLDSFNEDFLNGALFPYFNKETIKPLTYTCSHLFFSSKGNNDLAYKISNLNIKKQLTTRSIKTLTDFIAQAKIEHSAKPYSDSLKFHIHRNICNTLFLSASLFGVIYLAFKYSDDREQFKNDYSNQNITDITLALNNNGRLFGEAMGLYLLSITLFGAIVLFFLNLHATVKLCRLERIEDIESRIAEAESQHERLLTSLALLDKKLDIFSNLLEKSKNHFKNIELRLEIKTENKEMKR